MKRPLIILFGIFYKQVLRPFIFLFDSETIHNVFVTYGQSIGKTPAKYIFKFLFYGKNKILSQELFGITFNSPVGLSAGYDYQVKLTKVMPFLGFGFETVGTITNLAYEGNSKPRLGRLVKTQSLMVNKGYKNDGIRKVVQKLKGEYFLFPLGISIGKTNTTKLKTQKEAVDDIVTAFRVAEAAKLKTSYYELNISCPNLYGDIDFYEPQKLEQLLKAVFALKISKPVFIKMPISNTNAEIINMMDVIIKYPGVSAVIIGNLQKNRNDKSFDKEELRKYPMGNFSGKPTFERSNELIALVYQRYGDKIKIIGTGGIFTARDAYTKIKLGASLVQLITALIFEGPQVVARINVDLPGLLKKDGFKNISEAIGVSIKE